MVVLLTSIIVVLVAIGSRQVGYDAVKKKAYLTADIVKKSLTSHMINGNMQQRDVFLNSINDLDEVNDLWVIRAKSVSKQFSNSGLGNETPKDEIDEKVLRTGKEEVVITEKYNEFKRFTPKDFDELDQARHLLDELLDLKQKLINSIKKVWS